MEKSDEMMAGLFTVIIPSYNRAHLITEALDSVKVQSYRPIEIIVVDDGSSDNTQPVVRAWAELHSEGDALSLHYFYQDNAGPAAARNRGIKEVRGEYVQFLDSDDIIHRGRLKRVVDLFTSSSCEFIETGFEGFCSKCGEVYERHYGHTKTDAMVLLLLGRLWANTLRSAFHRSLVDRTGPWNEEMSCFEDYEYVARAIMLSKKNMAIHDVLASARRGGNERVSDRLKTYEGRTFRIHCESVICNGIGARDNLPVDALMTFASRLYMLGYRSNASGWTDLGQRCCDLADNLGVKLDARGKFNRLICRTGKYGGLICEFLYRTKNSILRLDKDMQIRHYCRKHST